ncbi:MAG: hypothetical protein AAGG75_23005 [Bacteroidota bacterium]
MSKALNFRQCLLIFGTPLFIILSMILLSRSAIFLNDPSGLSTAITFDLLLTSPLLYLFLIRNTTISKLTALPFFVVGLLVASFILPADQQWALSQFKTYVFPVIELAVLGTVIYKVRQTIKAYQRQKAVTPDFFTALRSAATSLLPRRLTGPVITEIAIIYYGFIHWKERPLAAHEFSYHKRSGMVSILGVFIFLIIVEAGVVHLLLERWSPLAAWILTFLSIYTCLQVFGIIRSLPKRPIAIREDRLELRFGILSETDIPLEFIERVENSRKRIDLKKGGVKSSTLDDLESHNTIIYLKEEHKLSGFYNIKKRFHTIALHVDEPQRFKIQLETAVEKIVQ